MNAATGPSTTIRVLKRSPNPTVDKVLQTAAKMPGSLRRPIVQILVDRPGADNFRLLLALFEQLDQYERDLVRSVAPAMAAVVEAELSSSVVSRVVAACRFAVHYELTQLLPALVRQAAGNPPSATQGLLAAVAQLARTLYEQAEAYRSDRSQHDPIFERRAAVQQLALAVDQFASLPQPELVESFLLLTPADHPTLIRILGHPQHAAHNALRDALTASPSRAAWELLARMLEDPGTPMPLLELAAARSDAPFIEFIAHTHRAPLTYRLVDNLVRLRNVGWLQRTGELATKLSDDACSVMLEHAWHTSAPRLQVFEFVRRVLEKPGGAARVRACELLAKLDVPRTTKVLQQLVDDADPLVAVQASAVLYGRGHLQLRSRLSELVAHRLPEVSQVACRALRRSSFLWYLSEFDSMTPEVRQSEGRVVWRVDGAARELLALELRGATVKRRVRAIEMVDAMGLVAEFIDMLVDLATDSDAEVRCAAVQRLAKSPRMSAVEALANAKRDKNGAVRRAAIEAEQQAAAASGHRDSPPQGDVP